MKIADTRAQDEPISPALHGKRRLRRFAAPAALLLLLLTALWWLLPAAKSWSAADVAIPRERVRTDTVLRRAFVRDISAQGQVVAAVSPKLYAPADGTVTLLQEAGATVSKGQVLASIDSPELTSRLEQEQASWHSLQTAYQRQQILLKKQQLTDQKAVDIAQVALTAAEREQRRHLDGYQRKAISELDYQKALDDLETARVQHRHAAADASLNKENLAFELQSLGQQLERQRLLVSDLQRQVDALQVRSPVDGLLGNLAVDNKTHLSKNQLILSVVDLSRFEVDLLVPESYANDLAVGLAVELSVEGKPWRGRLVTLSPEVQDNQVKGRVRFDAKAPPALRQNQRLSGRVLLEERDEVLQVARGQFLDASNGRFAYKISGDTAIRTSIETGARSIQAVEIVAGLQAGDQIITSGTETFGDAAIVKLN